MQHTSKPILRALAGETLETPPVWLMRQAGRYLPEYRATRAQAGDFLSLCYTPDLATEVTLQPIRRYGFDAAILFADILLVPQALGADLWFVTGEGPRLSTVTGPTDLAGLSPADQIHDHLAPVYQTVRNLAGALPPDVTLIGFAGAPWTVATYMIAGRGTPDQAPALALADQDRTTFEALLDLITEATIEYLLAQASAGAEVLKLFDSWAGALKGAAFSRYAVAPAAKIVAAIRAQHPHLPIIGFPRGVTPDQYLEFVEATGVQGLAIGTDLNRSWAAEVLQPRVCVQGNLNPALMVQGGPALTNATRTIRADFSHGPHIFNLGHGITPDADPDNVHVMLEALRRP